MPLLSSDLPGANNMDDPAALERLFPEPPIDQWGRYKLDGEAYTRVTTVAKALDATFLLDRWHERQVLNGMRLPALQYQLAALAEDDRDGLNKLATEAKARAGASDRAAIGTAIHRVGERVDTGQLPLERVPALVKADITAMLAVRNRAGLAPLHGWVEAVVANPELGVAGTIDRLMAIATEELVALIYEVLAIELAVGANVVVDLKTSRVLDWSYDAFAMQTGLYARCTHLWDRSTDRLLKLTKADGSPFIEPRVAFILWVPAGEGTAQLHAVRLEPEAHEAIDLALKVRRLAGFGKKATVLIDSEDPSAGLMVRAELLRGRAKRIIELVPQAAPAIADRFGPIPTFPEALATKHRYSADELDRIDAILSEGEAAMALPLATDAEVAKAYSDDRLTKAVAGEDRPADVDQPPPTVEQQRWADPAVFSATAAGIGWTQANPQPAVDPAWVGAQLQPSTNGGGSPTLNPQSMVDPAEVEAQQDGEPDAAVLRGPWTDRAADENYDPDALDDDDRRAPVVVTDTTPRCVHCQAPMVGPPYVHATDCQVLQPVAGPRDRHSTSSTAALGTAGIPTESYGDVPPQGPMPVDRPDGGPLYPNGAAEPEAEPATPLNAAVEAVRGAFLGAVVVDSHSGPHPELAALVERIKRLPLDLRGRLDAWVARKAIPGLNLPAGHRLRLASTTTIEEQVVMVTDAVDDMEAELATRLLEVEQQLGNLVGFLWTQVGLGPYTGPESITRDQLDAMLALMEAGNLGYLQQSEQGGVTSLLLTEPAKPILAKAIKAQHGSADAAKLACTRWAQALGRPKEWRLTTVKAMAGHPVLGPVLAYGPAIHTPEAASAEDTTDNNSKEQ